jgi:hypothetical protein
MYQEVQNLREVEVGPLEILLVLLLAERLVLRLELQLAGRLAERLELQLAEPLGVP